MCAAHLRFAEVTAALKGRSLVASRSTIKGLGKKIRARTPDAFAAAVVKRVAELDPTLQAVHLHIPGHADRIVPLTIAN